MNAEIFLAKGCAPSKQYRTRLGKGQFTFKYVIHDIEEEPNRTHLLKVLAVPCTILFDKDGEELKRLYGFAPDEKTINKIKAIFG